MSVGRNAEDQPILVVNDVQKEFESLEKTFEGMLRAVQESQSEDADASLQHVLLLASGVEEASVSPSTRLLRKLLWTLSCSKQLKLPMQCRRRSRLQCNRPKQYAVACCS